jgi:hypothetical protein
MRAKRRRQRPKAQLMPDVSRSRLEPRPGEVICGRFKIIEQLGEPGTTAIAYSAVDEVSGEEVLCKIAFDSSEESGQGMLLSQLHLLRRIASSDVVRVFDVFWHMSGIDRWLVLAMEQVKGPTVEEWLKNWPPLRQRLEVFSRASGALSAMHRVGLVHGDFHLGNVVMAEGRVVLIDPEAESVGSVRRAIPHQRMPVSVDGDLRGLAAVAERLLPDSDIQVITAIYKRLSEDPPTITAEIVASNTAAVLAGYLPGEASSLEDAARLNRSERDFRWKLYKDIRIARDLAFEALRIHIAASAFSVESVEVTSDPSFLKRESDSDGAERGTFADRILHFKSADGDQWVMRFDGQIAFRKPWAYGPAAKGLISNGKSQVVVGDEPPALNDLELRFEQGTGMMYVVNLSNGFAVPFDQVWIEHCLYVLVGLRAPLKNEPYVNVQAKPLIESAVGAAELSKGTRDLREAIDSGLKQSFKIITEQPEFGQRDRRVLDSRDSRERGIILEIASGVLNSYLPHIERIYCIDLSPTSGKVNTFEIHVGLKPAGTPPETWTFPLGISL